MAVTVQRLRRVEIWSKWAAAGGVRQAVIADVVAAQVTARIDNTDRLSLTIPIISDAAAFLVSGAVIRIDESDGVFDEWKVVQGPVDNDSSAERTVQAALLSATDLVDCDLVRRIDSDGAVVMDFESVSLSPADHITNWVLPALVRGGLAWVTAGVITPTKLIDLTFQWDSPLAVLQRIAEQTEMELDIRRVGVGGYVIDLLPQVNSAAGTADLRFDKNLQPGSEKSQDAIEQATRVFPRGAQEDEAFATMGRATWKVQVIAGLVVTLADPAGGVGPIQFDGQLAGLNGTTQAYLRKPDGTLTIVNASSAANQTVTVASVAAVAVGDLIQFRADAAGSDMVWLDSPPDRLTYGLKTGTVDVSDAPSTNNLLKNSTMRSWPGSSSAPPPNWSTIGLGTVARQAAAPFTTVGGFSIHRTTLSDGEGLVSDAVPIFPTQNNPYFSGYAGVWVVSGAVRVELVFTTPTGTVVDPILPDVASNSVLGQFDDLGVAGIDAFAIGATAVQLRVVQHGTTAADFYLDYAQATQSSAQLPFAEASGGTRLWQAANEKLRTNGAPLISYTIPVADLAAMDPIAWADDKITIGAKVRVTHPKLGIAVITRLVELTRDYRVPGDTKITLSNKPDDITGSRPSPPPRAPADVSPRLIAPSPPVLSASFDATGQLIINSSGDASTTKQRIAWATGAAPSAATVRAAAAINQQNVSGLATGSVYPPGTTVFIAAFAYNLRGFESAPLAVVSRTREGTGAPVPPTAYITPTASALLSDTVNLSGEVGAGGLAPLSWQKRTTVGASAPGAWSAWVPATGGNALPFSLVILRHAKWATVVEFQTRDANNVISPIANYTVDSRTDFLDDTTGDPRRDRVWNDGGFPATATTNDGNTLSPFGKDSRGFFLDDSYNFAHHSLDDVSEAASSPIYHRVTVNATDPSGNVDMAKSGVVGKAVETVRNPTFESGDRDWTVAGGWSIVNDPANAYAGNWVAKYVGIAAAALRNSVLVAVQPGDVVRGSAMMKVTAGTGSGVVRISWINSSGVEIGDFAGPSISSSTYVTAKVTAVAPSSSAFARVEAVGQGGSSTTVFVDQFALSLMPSMIASETQVSHSTGVQTGSGSTAFGINRHNDEQSGKDVGGGGSTKTFGVSYDAIPQIRALIQKVKSYSTSAPGADQSLDVRAVNVTVSTYDPRAKLVTGGTATAETENPAATLNGTPAASVLLTTGNSAAFWNLANANATLTRYTAHFDVDTTTMDPTATMHVELYKNNGVSSTSWTLVASRDYFAGVSLTNEQLSFDAAMTLNWDVRILITYDKPTAASLTVKALTYNQIGAGTELDATAAVDAAVIFQAMEAPS